MSRRVQGGGSGSLLQSAAFNALKTLSNLVFSVLSFAYAARVLGDVGIGQASFAKSIVSFFTMLAMMGMQYYGAREAARLRDNPARVGQFVREMLWINGCTVAIAYALLFLAMFAVPRLADYRLLLCITGAEIALQWLGMEWLYQAMEEYRAIAVRAMLVQAAAFAAMFVLVRRPEDVAPYALVRLATTSGAQLWNFLGAGKLVRWRRRGRLRLRRHLKPLLWLTAMAVSVELFTVLDTAMLGFLRGDAAVGRYTAAVKVDRMVNVLIISMGAAMIPRLSYYVGQRKYARMRKLAYRMFHCVFLFSVPAAVGLFMLSDEIILLFSGAGFASAARTMRILTPIVLTIPFSTVVSNQILVPLGREGLILRSTLTGAVTNFTLNLLLIPRLAENGAAIATVLAEAAVGVVCLWNVGRYCNRRAIFAGCWQYVVAALPIPLLVSLLRLMRLGAAAQLCLSMAVSAPCYFALLLLLRNRYLLEFLRAARRGRGKAR